MSNKQKFRKYTTVKVAKDMPVWMAHFESDFIGIVNGTYKQLCGGDDIDSYSIHILEDGKIVNTIAWYHEHQLEYVDYNVEEALRLIEEYE